MLKAAYNVQWATEGRYALAYDIFPNPTDTRTLIPFLDRIEKDYFALPDFLVADAAYGSEQNIEDIILNRLRTALITYNMYRKEKKKNTKTILLTPPTGIMMPNKMPLLVRTDKLLPIAMMPSGQVSIVTSDNLRSMNVKIVQAVLYEINVKWEAQKKMIREQLSDEEMSKLYGKRKIDVEPFFGFLKANLGFTRFSVRGKPKLENELGFHIKIRCEIHLFIIFA